MAISAALIKELRGKTGVGILQCRSALQETDGDLNAAIDYLRKLDPKTKLTSRETSEGLLGGLLSDCCKKAAVVEVQCETDFAARNENFIGLVDKLVGTGLTQGAADLDGLLAIEDGGESLEQQVKVAINTIGENVRVSRYGYHTLEGHGGIGCYVHTNGKIVSLVGVKAGKAESDNNPAFTTMLKQLCMHIAGTPTPPLALTREGVDAAVIEKERQGIREAMEANPKDSKKPENIKEKIITGKINRFFKECVLPEQAFVMDDKKSVGEMVAGVAKELGDSFEMVWFERWSLGA